MKFLIVATFKSNKLKAEVESWVKELAPLAKQSSAEIVVAPSFPHLFLISQSSLKLASQDVSPFPPGSYTGAVNTVQLKDLGVSYCLVGHSERRRYFHETHAEIANKIRELLAVGITPILCLAEDDLFPQLAALPSEVKEQIIYCFEPPSNIGGTESAPLEEIKRVVGLIRESIGNCRVMYGGSVNADNLNSLLSLNIEGLLVSSASLDPHNFSQLINTYDRSPKE